MRYQIPIKTGSIVSILIGAGVALYGGCQVGDGLAAGSWPTVEGVITASSTTSKTKSSSSGSGRTTVYRAYERVKGAWEERFERKYGFWRGLADEAVARYLDCGVWDNAHRPPTASGSS